MLTLKINRGSLSLTCMVIMISQILMDSLKRKAYDDELRREELLSVFNRFHNAPRRVLFLLSSSYFSIMELYKKVLFYHIRCILVRNNILEYPLFMNHNGVVNHFYSGHKRYIYLIHRKLRLQVVTQHRN